MKKLISLLLATLLMLSLAAGAFADDIENWDWEDFEEAGGIPIDLPNVGVRFMVPLDVATNLQGHADLEYGEELSYGSGAYYTEFGYYAMSEEEFNNLDEFDESRYLPIIAFACIRNGGDLSAFEDAGIHIGWSNSWKMATVGDYTHYLIVGTEDDELPAGFQEPYSSEYLGLLQKMVDAGFEAEYSVPVNPYSEQIGQKISFHTTDLDGRPVSSEELFVQNEVTMLNFWGTWCGHCVRELPELERINGNLQSMGCGVVGVLTDGQDPDDLADAKEMLQDAGVTYPVINIPEGGDGIFDLGSLPITYFVNRNGELVGVPVKGAQIDAYEKAVRDILAGNTPG